MKKNKLSELVKFNCVNEDAAFIRMMLARALKWDEDSYVNSYLNQPANGTQDENKNK